MRTFTSLPAVFCAALGFLLVAVAVCAGIALQ
jgi:hypothetical protein